MRTRRSRWIHALLLAALVVLMNLLTDLAYALVDPRIRIGR